MLGWYFHLPSCATTFEVTTLVDESLRLLVDAHRRSGARVSLALTGSLLAQVEAHRPGDLAPIAAAIDEGIVELLATSYHEVCPFLIPSSYLRRQIALDVDIKERLFGCRPTAFWSGNLAWTPMLPGILSQLGISTAIIDEAHLREAHQTQLWRWLGDDALRMGSLLVDTLMSEKVADRRYRLHQADDAILDLRILSNDLRRALSFGTSGAIHHAWDDAPLDGLIADLRAGEALSESAWTFCGDDGDRINPVSIGQYRRLLDALGTQMACISAPGLKVAAKTLAFLPAHAPGGIDFWQDPVARAYSAVLDELYRAVEAGRVDRDDVLPLQDVFPIFWKRIARAGWYYRRAQAMLGGDQP